MRKRMSDKKVIQGLILFCALIVVTLSLIGDKGLIQLKKLKDREQALISELEELKKEKQTWIHKVISLKQNNTYLENIAREELGLVHESEKIILLPTDPPKLTELRKD